MITLLLPYTTLFRSDATEWHYNALNRALALFGYSITRYEHATAYNGLPTNTKLRMLSVEKGLPPSLHRLVNRLKQRSEEHTSELQSLRHLVCRFLLEAYDES